MRVHTTYGQDGFRHSVDIISGFSLYFRERFTNCDMAFFDSAPYETRFCDLLLEEGTSDGEDRARARGVLISSSHLKL
jgi:hypothetical protein